jgi:beta-N-acetylhexosaminidase
MIFRGRGFSLLAILLPVVLICCAQSVPTIEPKEPITPEFLTDSAATHYADSVISLLSTREQIAQLLMVPVYSRTDTTRWSVEEKWVRDLGLGGIIVMQGGPVNQRIRIAKLQAESKVPLMVASDAEWGLGMRLDSTRSFPRAMTLGATGNAELVEEFGYIVGLSLRNTGVHVNFAPVIDVNSNPDNPVIGSRSFGEDVELVGELGLAYSNGLQRANILATAKHFPGHGDSNSDSHKTLPVINQSRARLDSVELAPFKVLFDGGVGAVMIAHLDVPALDSTDSQPSTLSPTIVDTLLRQEMGFKGLAFTDALSMKGFADFAGDRPRARDALLAGNDVLLFPGDPVAVINEVALAIEEGTLDSIVVAEKCRRVLMAKFWTKAYESVPSLDAEWDPVAAEKVHMDILEASITVLTNRDRCLPWLKSSGNIVVLSVADNMHGNAFTDQLQNVLGRAHNVTSYRIGKNAEGLDRSDISKACREASLVVVNFLETSNRPSKKYGVRSVAVKKVSEHLLESYSDSLSTTKWCFNLFANPYALNADWTTIIEKSSGLIVAYQDDNRTQRVVANAISGAGSANGHLPITPPSMALNVGEGLGLGFSGALDHDRLGWNSSAYEGDWGPTLLIDSIVNQALLAGAMPGCRVIVAHKSEIVHDKCYGTTDGQRPVEKTTIYDLASITKIAATSLCLMKLNQSGYFDLDDKLAKHMPDLRTLELGTRTFREVLAHQSGLYPWIPFYVETLPDSIDEVPIDTMYQRIYDSELRPAGKYRYSDLGYYLFHNYLNKWNGTEAAIDSLSQNKIYTPLGLYSMGFNPLKKFSLDQIAPTENDTIFRKCTVHGTVHDQGSHMLDGVCCHAGLFSDAYDLARIGYMLLNHGRYAGYKVVKPSTIDEWTSRAYPGTNNRRGVGFDKKGLTKGGGAASELASESSFGHSGFTGTLLWVDPEFDLVYVFLSNRTFPTSENRKLITMNVRTEIHRVFMEHIISNTE